MTKAYTINNNQEAIKEIYYIRNCFKPTSVQYQALSMAIEAMEQTDKHVKAEGEEG